MYAHRDETNLAFLTTTLFPKTTLGRVLETVSVTFLDLFWGSDHESCTLGTHSVASSCSPSNVSRHRTLVVTAITNGGGRKDSNGNGKIQSTWMCVFPCIVHMMLLHCIAGDVCWLQVYSRHKLLCVNAWIDPTTIVITVDLSKQSLSPVVLYEVHKGSIPCRCLLPRLVFCCCSGGASLVSCEGNRSYLGLAVMESMY